MKKDPPLRRPRFRHSNRYSQGRPPNKPAKPGLVDYYYDSLEVSGRPAFALLKI
jgi:hypothetical protein